MYIGMLNRGYVTRAQTITLSAKAEAGQRAQFFVNGSTLGYVDVSADNCTIPDTAEALDAETASPGATTQNKYTTDGLLVRTAHQCNASIDYTFTDDGANAEGGEPKHGYLFEMRVLDNAGNESEKSKEMLVYHDTVAPKKPVIQKFGPDHVYAEVERYAETEFVMTAPNGTETARQLLRADKFGSTDVFKLIFNDQYGKYKVSVTSWDQAGNVSEVAVQEIEKLQNAVGGGSIENINNNNIELFITVASDGTYKITSYSIPKPLILATNLVTSERSIEGVSIRKGHTITATIKYSASYLRSIDPGCSGLMGYLNCIFVTAKIETTNAPVEHVLTTVAEENDAHVGSQWMESSSRFSIPSNQIEVNNKYKAKTTIYGQFSAKGITINYRGTTAQEAQQNSGLSSAWSSIFTAQTPVVNPEEIMNYAVSPVSHENCDNLRITSYFGTRLRVNEDGTIGPGLELHDGIDIVNPSNGVNDLQDENGNNIDGCTIKSVYSGNATRGNEYGNDVRVVHNQVFTTIYGHGRSYLGSTGNVDAGEDVMQMGTTGRSSGVHLHFTIRMNGAAVDPLQYITIN